jgi:hypothetical protein
VDHATGTLLVPVNTTSEGAGRHDVALVRLSASSGREIEHTTWGGTGDDVCHDLALNGDIAYLVGETSSRGAGRLDGFTLRANQRRGAFPSPAPSQR